MVAIFFPEALNQGHATLFDVVRGGTVILGVCLTFGFSGYALTIVPLGFFTAFAKHLPFRVIHKASMIVAVAFLAIIPLYLIPFFIFKRSNLIAILGIGLALLVLVSAIVTAVRIVWCAATSPETH
ncbi:MAG: hypothetical protein WAM85_10635 [Terracidiphilus sp.]